ncbi:MAG: hypothetical protein K2Q01_05905, partial [Rickettsiales bacterium]|nr:hypothetical protein [Rickettsiales bacterium]
MQRTILAVALWWAMQGWALASMPGQIAPQGNFFPLTRGMPARAVKLPERGARFLPLAPRNATSAPFAETLP